MPASKAQPNLASPTFHLRLSFQFFTFVCFGVCFALWEANLRRRRRNVALSLGPVVQPQDLPIWVRGRQVNLSVKCLRVTKGYGRWGNNLIQLRHVANVATFYGLTQVFIPRGFVFLLEPIRWNEQVTIFPVDKEEDLDCYTHRFFTMERFQEGLPYDDFPREFVVEYVRRLQVIELSRDTLVLPLRSGDVFSRWPAPLYGQPGCDYYEYVVGTRRWLSVLVFAEDEGNPCIQRFTSLADVRIGMSLVDDLRLLLGSVHLVLGVSTFAEMCGELAPRLEQVFLYTTPNFHLLCPPVNGICWVCQAAEQFWNENLRRWTNSRSQRNRMLSGKSFSGCSPNVSTAL